MKKSTLLVLLVVVALALVAWVGCTTKEAVEAPAEATTSGLNVISAKWAGSAHADAASEAFNHWTNHPDWTRRKEALAREGKVFETNEGDGIKIFRNAVDFIKQEIEQGRMKG